jgi:hypothetical protein
MILLIREQSLDQRQTVWKDSDFVETILGRKGDSAANSQRFSNFRRRDFLLELAAYQQAFTNVVLNHDADSHPAREWEDTGSLPRSSFWCLLFYSPLLLLRCPANILQQKWPPPASANPRPPCELGPESPLAIRTIRFHQWAVMLYVHCFWIPYNFGIGKFRCLQRAICAPLKQDAHNPLRIQWIYTKNQHIYPSLIKSAGQLIH